MYLMSSGSDFTGDCELTTKTYGVRCVSETGAKSLMVPNGRSVNRTGFVALLPAARSRVQPPGPAFATKAAPMVLDAPGRLSTITGLPREPEGRPPSTG